MAGFRRAKGYRHCLDPANTSRSRLPFHLTTGTIPSCILHLHNRTLRQDNEMRNHGNRLAYAVGSLVVLFGLFMFWATRDIPLPKNARAERDIINIDLSNGATNEAEKKETLFVVPAKFKPKVSEGAIAFHFKFPEGTPYSGNDSPIPRDSIRVVIKHHAKIEAALSTYILRNIQPIGGPLFAVPWFVERKDGVEIYQYKINASAMGTYFNFVAKDGNNILADDPGSWSRNYEISRKLSPHIELTFLVGKSLIRDSEHFIEDVSAVDKAVVNLVRSFQPNN